MEHPCGNACRWCVLASPTMHPMKHSVRLSWRCQSSACAILPGQVAVLLRLKQRMAFREIGVSYNQGYLFGGPFNRDYSILGSILGVP